MTGICIAPVYFPGNPLQYSCLENPRDGGAWRAVVYGVAQSWTRLKRLSSSSSVFPYKIFINSKEKKVTGLQWRNYLNPMIIVNITSKRHTDYIVLICCADKDTHHFCDFVAKNAQGWKPLCGASTTCLVLASCFYLYLL